MRYVKALKRCRENNFTEARVGDEILDVSIYKTSLVSVEGYDVIKIAIANNDVTMNNYRALKRPKSASI